MAYGGRSETRITERPLPAMQAPTVDPPPADLNRRSYEHMAGMKDTVWYAMVVSSPVQVIGWWVQILIGGRTVAASLTTATRSVRKGDKVGVSNTGGHWVVVENYTPPPPVAVPAPPTGTIPTVSGSTTVPTKPRTRTIRATSTSISSLLPAPASYSQSWAQQINSALTDIETMLGYLRTSRSDTVDVIDGLLDKVDALTDAAASINGRVTNAQSALNTAASLVNGTRESVAQLRGALGPDGERIVK